jgi:RHS repeat-associated protein
VILNMKNLLQTIIVSLLLSLPLNAQEVIFSDGFENTPPVIISVPVTTGEPGVLYSYDVDATDFNGDLLAYYFIVAPQGMEIDAVTGEISWTPDKAGDYAVTVEVSDGKHGFASQAWSIEVLPPDPVAIAPENDPTVATTVFESTKFLYSGYNPIQTGVEEGTVNPIRAAVVRGNVMTRDGVPLSGVTISILNHEEYGQTISRIDGAFDMVVNGGGLLSINYAAQGHLPAHRQLNVPWQDFIIAPDVALVTLDPIVTTINMNAGVIQMAEGSMESDADGERHAMILFPQGTTADLVMPDGTMVPVSSLNVRATEYTVGPNGPAAMPGPLPPTSAYTYAVELSSDEAIAVGASDVRFNQPVPVFVENFLDFPAGTAVPAGYYDRSLGQWIAAPDGLVIDIVGVSGDLANIDIDGSGNAADTSALSELGIDAAERTQIASIYGPGDSLWRIPVEHFTPWDYNWPYGLPFGASFPGQPYTGNGTIYEGSCEAEAGSFIDCQNQALGERIGVQGTPFTLNYRSNRQSGYASLREANIQLSGDSVPDSLARIDLDIYVAGQHEKYSYPPTTNLDHFFSWDGLDAYGRQVIGTQPVSGRISYVYPAVYSASAETRANNFGVPGDGENIGANRSALEIFLTQDFSLPFGGATTAGQVFGGWSLDIHHSYDAQARTLYLGDGRQRDAKVQGPVVKLLVEEGDCWDDLDGVLEGVPLSETCMRDIYDIDTGLDGNTYMILNECIVRIEADMTVTRIGGVPDDTYPAICTGDLSGALPLEGAARETAIEPLDIAVGADGSVYFTDGNRVGRIRPDGMLEHIAGTGNEGNNFDTGVATQIDLLSHGYDDIAVGPDGSIYLSQYRANGYEGIRRVDPNGELTIYYKAGGVGCSSDGTCATQDAGLLDMTVGLDGRVYFRDKKAHVWAVETTGSLSLIGGLGPCLPNYSDPAKGADCGSGGPAVDAGFWTIKGNFDIDQDGSLLMWDHRAVWRITPDGIIAYAAGVHLLNSNGYSADSWLAAQIGFQSEWGAVMPDGTLLVAQTYKALYAISPALPGFTNGDVGIASSNGQALYVFDGTGRHRRTLNTLTGNNIYEFGYDGTNQLVKVTDAWGSITSIERNGSGQATTIIAHTGERTTLRMNNDNMLSAMIRENNDEVTAEYATGGLLTRFVDAAGQFSEYTYDASGRVLSATDKVGNTQFFARTESMDNYQITRTTEEGQQFIFDVTRSDTGEEVSVVGNSAGGQIIKAKHRDNRNILSRLNGALIESGLAPSPRFGMNASYVDSLTTTTPGGLMLTQSKHMATNLADPKDPFSYDLITMTHEVNGQHYTAVFDHAARSLSETTPEGRMFFVTYDEQMLPLSIVGDIGMTPLNISYTASGLLSMLTQGNKSLSVTYDVRERPISVIDAGGNEVKFVWSVDNQLNSLSLPGGESYSMMYDPLGRVTMLEMPSGDYHLLTWTELGFLSSYQAPGMAVQTLSYDRDRRPKSLSLPSGSITEFGYDPQGRLVTITNPEGTITHRYGDFSGSVSKVIFEPDGGGTTESLEMATDANVMLTQTWGGSIDAAYQYVYNNNFRLNEIQLSVESFNKTTDLGYDNDGMLTHYGPFMMTRNGLVGTLTSISDGTFSSVYTRDSIGRLINYHVELGGEFYSFSALLDNTGRITNRTETLAGVTHTFSYSYTANGELESVSEGDTVLEQYSYDQNGNRVNSHLGTASFNSANQVVFSEGVAHVYDANGRLISRGADIFSYHGDGRLKTATVGGVTVSYKRDAVGRRIARTVLDGKTRYLYGNPYNTIQLTESVANDNMVSSYYYDDQMRLYAIKRGVDWFYVGTDGLGSPRMVTDVAGNTVKLIKYDGYGNVLSDSNPAFELPVGFAGGLYDSVTRLVRFGMRDYDPQTGRFMTLDPLSLGGGSPNLYLYVNNDPVNQFDRLGLYGWEDFQDDVVDWIVHPSQMFRNIVGDANKATDGGFSNTNSLLNPPGSKFIDGEAASYAFDAYGDIQSIAEPTGGAGTGWLGVSAVKLLCKAWDWIPGPGGAAGLFSSKYGPKQENPSSPLDNVWSPGAAAIFTFEYGIEGVTIPFMGGQNSDPR